MDVKIQIKAISKDDIPGVYTGNTTFRIYEQFLPIVKEFAESDSECISLLSGDPVDEKILNNLHGHVKLAIEKLGYADKMKITCRTKANNAYIIKVGE